jgi:hypothetical protein
MQELTMETTFRLVPASCTGRVAGSVRSTALNVPSSPLARPRYGLGVYEFDVEQTAVRPGGLSLTVWTTLDDWWLWVATGVATAASLGYAKHRFRGLLPALIVPAGLASTIYDALVVEGELIPGPGLLGTGLAGVQLWRNGQDGRHRGAI